MSVFSFAEHLAALITSGIWAELGTTVCGAVLGVLYVHASPSTGQCVLCDHRLCAEAGFSATAAQTARRRLVERGLIECSPGPKGTRYTILPVHPQTEERTEQ